MDVQFYGANCLTVMAGATRLVIDDNLADMGAKSITKPTDLVLFTAAHAARPEARLLIDMPGEYEAGDISVYGIAARAHIDEANQRTATMYKIVARDLRLLVTGHVYPSLSDTDLERIGTIDVVAVPVGGNGYTLDATGAMDLLKKLEPKLVVPTYYADSALQFSVPPQTLEQAQQNLSLEIADTTSKLRLKAGSLPESMQLVILEKS